MQFFLFAPPGGSSYNAPRSEGNPLGSGRSTRVTDACLMTILYRAERHQDEKVCDQGHSLLQAFVRSALSNEPTLSLATTHRFTVYPACAQTRFLSVNIHPELSFMPTAPACGLFFVDHEKTAPGGGSVSSLPFQACSGRCRPKWA